MSNIDNSRVRKKNIFLKWILNNSGMLITFTPFFFTALIRLLATDITFKWDMLNFDDLSVTNAIVCLLTNQNLISKDYDILNEDDKKDKDAWAVVYLFLFFFSIVFYSILTFLKSQCHYLGFSQNIKTDICLKLLISLIVAITFSITNHLQKSLKIRIGL